MSKHRSNWMLSVAVVAALSPLALGQSTWTGGSTTTAGTLNSGAATAQSVNYLSWNTTDAVNWNGAAYVQGNVANFGAASGTFVIVPSSSMNPASMNFDGGATYDFVRANTSIANSWANSGTAVAGALAADTFSTATPFGAFGTTGTLGNYPLTTASTFTGKVYLGARTSITNYGAPTGGGTPTSSNGTVNTIAGGYVEFRDQAPLRAATGSTQNAIRVDMTGGELAINIGSPAGYSYRAVSSGPTIQPASSGLVGPLNVNANATFTNAGVDIYGRARQAQNLWQGPMTVASGATLTINTGGGAQFGGSVTNTTSGGHGVGGLFGNGTVKIGSAATSSSGSNRLRLNGNYATGSATLTFDLGSTGIIQTTQGVGSTALNLGAIVAPAGTFINGTNGAPTASVNEIPVSIGAVGGNYTIGGTITNGYASSTAAGVSGAAPLASRIVANTAVTKVGAGSLTINSPQYYGGSTNVNVGSLVTGNAGALGSSANNVTVASGATLDTAGVTQTAGKQYVLSGGSLVNNTTTAVTLGSGASAHLAPTTSAGTGSWSGTGNTPTVSITGGGGSGATGRALLQLGWISFAAADGATLGTGYTSEPQISFSAPDLAGGRAPKVVAGLDATGNINIIDVVDPGWGYTKVPTVTVTNPSGFGGTTLVPVIAMTASAIDITNAGTGYTSAPTVTLGGSGYVANSATAIGGFGSVTLTASTNSNIGGSGNIVVNAVVTGLGNLVKTGAGTVTLTGANTYSGTTAVNAGTLRVNGNNQGTGAVSVASGATLGGSGTIAGAVSSSSNSIVGPGNSIGTLTVGSATLGGTFQVEYNGASIDLLSVIGSLDITAATVDFDALGAPPVTPLVFASYGSLTGIFAGVLDLPSGTSIDYNYNGLKQIALVPEPTTLAGLGAVVVMGLRRRRK